MGSAVQVLQNPPLTIAPLNLDKNKGQGARVGARAMTCSLCSKNAASESWNLVLERGSAAAQPHRSAKAFQDAEAAPYLVTSHGLSGCKEGFRVLLAFPGCC